MCLRTARQRAVVVGNKVWPQSSGGLSATALTHNASCADLVPDTPKARAPEHDPAVTQKQRAASQRRSAVCTHRSKRAVHGRPPACWNGRIFAARPAASPAPENAVHPARRERWQAPASERARFSPDPAHSCLGPDGWRVCTGPLRSRRRRNHPRHGRRTIGYYGRGRAPHPVSQPGGK